MLVVKFVIKPLWCNIQDLYIYIFKSSKLYINKLIELWKGCNSRERKEKTLAQQKKNRIRIDRESLDRNLKINKILIHRKQSSEEFDKANLFPRERDIKKIENTCFNNTRNQETYALKVTHSRKQSSF